MGEFITVEKQREALAGLSPEQKKFTINSLMAKGHELEGLNAKFEFGEAIKNVPSSAWEYGKNIVGALTNPLQTAKAMGDLARGGLRKATQAMGIKLAEGGITGTAKEQELFDAVIDGVVERYGGKEKILNTLEKDPVGVLADISAIISLGGGVVKGAGLATKGIGKTLVATERVADKAKNLLRKPHERIEPFYDAIKSGPEKVAAAGEKISEVGGKIIKAGHKLDPMQAIFPSATAAARKINKHLFYGARQKFMGKATGLIGSKGEKITKTTQLAGKTKRIEGRDIIIPKTVETYLAEIGVHGTPDQMHSQVTKIQLQTQDKVDALLRSVPGTHRSKSATRFLEELQGAYGKVKKGEFIPMKNMSQDMEKILGDIQGLLQKSKTPGGMTLTELNKVKRLGDQILNIYDRSGSVKAGIKAEKLSGLRSSIRGHIENIAKKNGIPDIQKLNKQTQVNLLTRKHLEDMMGLVDERSAVGDQIIFLMGLTGTVATGGIAPLVGAGSVVLGREVLRQPRIRSFIATRMTLLMENEFKTLERGADIATGVRNKKFWDIIRRERKLIQNAFPEIRVAGKIQEKAKEVENK